MSRPTAARLAFIQALSVGRARALDVPAWVGSDVREYPLTGAACTNPNGEFAALAPVALAKAVQSKLVCDLRCVHCIWKILLVGENQQHGVAQLVLPEACTRNFVQRAIGFLPPDSYLLLASAWRYMEHACPTPGMSALYMPPCTHLIQHAVQLISRLPHSIAIVAVHHKDKALRVLEVVPPQRPNLRIWDLRSWPGGLHRLSSYLVLAAHIPNGEANVLILHRLHVEAWRQKQVGSKLSRYESMASGCLTNGGDSGHDLPEFKLVENRGLAGSIQADLSSKTLHEP